MCVMSEGDFSVQVDDVVCFSAGLTGAPFGAGTIHAYLASDRKPPQVAAGISLGALTAAVMERCYRDLEHSRTEAARWRWYRRYLSYLLDRPFDVVWDAIPNPSDLIADLPPVQDLNLPLDENGETFEPAKEREVEARRKLHLIAMLGNWFAHLPVKISAVAWLVVRYVRHKERYPKPPLLRLWNFLCWQANFLWTVWMLLFHMAWRPFWVPEWSFRYKGSQIHSPRWQRIRPLLGWKVWLPSFFLCLAVISLGSWRLFAAIADLVDSGRLHFPHVGWLIVLLFGPVIPVYVALIIRRLHPSARNGSTHRVIQSVLHNLDIDKSLLSDFPMLLKLWKLFSEDGRIPRMRDCLFPVLLVAAPLQILPSGPDQYERVPGPNQLWPATKGDCPVVRALRACLAVSPWFAPWTAKETSEGDDRAAWIRKPDQLDRLDLVDGSAVRHNPLPALFRYLKQDEKLAARLNRSDALVHLVYNVPIRWKPEPRECSINDESEEPRLPNIVDTAFSGLQLARRRDSRLEVIRTNQMSRIQRTLQECTGRATSPPIHTITVDEIAPQDELQFKNNLKPTETEILSHIAAGCRQTLSVLYGDELNGSTNCWEFLRSKAHKREWNEAPSVGLPGLAEVCRHCTRILQPIEKPPENLLPACFRAGDGALVRRFPNLSGERPRVVFLASGGVFRGSFHIGMLGAMLALDIKPDMIVGASVGTLTGAVFGSILNAKLSCKKRGDDCARAKFHQLAKLFLEVDDRVALTKTFKAAAKDLGIRGRRPGLRLSPNQLRKMVKEGSRKDAGAAATGAPPALIDAISELFLIPYRETANIAADFVAGHVSEAVNDFWSQIRKETIDRLGIHDAVLGATLIEKEIGLLLKDDLCLASSGPMDALQPFLQHGIAFFATTVNLVTESITTLGAELDRTSYDPMEALLASSAFPAAFAPRRASALYPGVGRRDIFYGDGGMFDNLPGLSALEILSEIQQDRLTDTIGEGRWRQELVRRFQEPDLIIVGSLNVKQPLGLNESYDSVLKSASRSKRLADNEKILGMQRAARKIDRQLGQVAAQPAVGDKDKRIPRQSEEFLNGIVNAAILAVYPSDEDHLNGTFEFCSSLGLKRDRVRSSITDGCFQTLLELYTGQQAENDSILGRSLAATGVRRLGIQNTQQATHTCPYFRTETGDIRCPFDGAADNLYATCVKDSTHKALVNKIRLQNHPRT